VASRGSFSPRALAFFSAALSRVSASSRRPSLYAFQPASCSAFHSASPAGAAGKPQAANSAAAIQVLVTRFISVSISRHQGRKGSSAMGVVLTESGFSPATLATAYGAAICGRSVQLRTPGPTVLEPRRACGAAVRGAGLA